jgi:hypothetical protein
MNNYDSNGYKTQIEAALFACKTKMQSGDAFAIASLRLIFKVPANFGRAIQEAGIARKLGRGNWQWIEREGAGDTVERVILACRRIDKEVADRAAAKQAASAPEQTEQKEPVPLQHEMPVGSVEPCEIQPPELAELMRAQLEELREIRHELGRLLLLSLPAS